MTPEQRAAFIRSSLVIWDLLASYGKVDAAELAAELREHGDDLDDDLVIHIVDKVLAVSARELVGMGQALRAAAEIGSDYAAAFTAVRAEPATEALRRKGYRQRRRARALQAEGLKVHEIAVTMDLSVRRVQQLLRPE